MPRLVDASGLGLGLIAVNVVDRPPASAAEHKLSPPGQVSLGAGDGSTGPMTVVVRFAQLTLPGQAPIIDSDGDITLPGAFPSIDVPFSAWGHGSWEKGLAMLPPGRGQVRVEGQFAVFRGRLFDTAAGRETFATLKELAELAQFSYGYNVLDFEYGFVAGQAVRFLKKLDLFEISPVLRAAGVGTRLVETSASSTTSLAVAAAAHHNELALAGMRKGRSRVVGWAPDGSPIRLLRSARNTVPPTKDAA
jgi:hypothetical protein